MVHDCAQPGACQTRAVLSMPGTRVPTGPSKEPETRETRIPETATDRPDCRLVHTVSTCAAEPGAHYLTDRARYSWTASSLTLRHQSSTNRPSLRSLEDDVFFYPPSVRRFPPGARGRRACNRVRSGDWRSLCWQRRSPVPLGDSIRDSAGRAKVRVDGALGSNDGAVEPAGTSSRRAAAARAGAKPRS